MTDTPLTVTMAEIYKHQPCAGGWAKLRKHTGLPATDDTTPVSLLTILDSNGFDDALWCLWAIEGRDREIRLFAVWCARQVQHLMTDPRSLAALDVAERYANGEATDDELAASWAAASAAANGEATDDELAASWAAASAAANAAARASWASWAASWAAASAAASAAARASWASWAAAGAAASAAAWAAQEARFREMVGGAA